MKMEKSENKGIIKQLVDLIEDSKDVVELFFNSNGRAIEIVSIEYDSRKVRKGSLFVAVEGFAVDGHSYVDEVAARGAVAVVVSRKRADEFRHLIKDGVALLVSDNTRKPFPLSRHHFTVIPPGT
jgi:UDP-N-acetylmuramyl tripeptide synthase